MDRVYENEYFHLRTFEDLLYDAVYTAYLADDIDDERDDHGHQFTLARCSVLNTVLLFECGANCCLDALKLSGSYLDDVDKLPYLSKYEYFLSRVRPDLPFDRGCQPVQHAAELKRVRDEYVHPKVKKRKYVKIKEGLWEVDLGRTELLQIPRSQRLWKVSHAVSALRAANNFFNYFFIECCRFDANTVCELLLGSDEASIPAKAAVSIDGVGGLTRAVQQWGIDFRFIGKTV